MIRSKYIHVYDITEFEQKIKKNVTKSEMWASHIWDNHYNDVIMDEMASQITSLMIVYSTIYSGDDQIKHQNSVSLVFVWGIHRWSVNSPHKWPVTRKMFPFDDVNMNPCVNCGQLDQTVFSVDHQQSTYLWYYWFQDFSYRVSTERKITRGSWFLIQPSQNIIQSSVIITQSNIVGQNINQMLDLQKTPHTLP